MSSEYTYTKSGVNPAGLTIEIKKSSITKTLEYINYADVADGLKIYFDQDLSSEEETTLDGLVSTHSGAVTKNYRMFCNDCQDDTYGMEVDTPTKCPVCEGTNITTIIEQEPYQIMKDQDDVAWGHFQDNSGTIVIAKWGDLYS